MKSNIGSSSLLALSIAGLLLVGNARQARAEDGCSNESLRGRYAIRGSGNAMSGPFTGPVAFMGILRFDGAGHLEGNFTQRLNTAGGPITLHVPIGGSYSVNADCTGEDMVVNQVNGAFNIQELILIDQGKEFIFVVTTAGAPPIVSGSARKLSRRESDPDQ